MKSIDTIVIGAGVIGLSCARELAIAGREVFILEAESKIGSGISSRNSEVIHAGIYYPSGSLKARLCVEGNRLLQDYAGLNGVPYKMLGKLIVATNYSEEEKLEAIEHKARDNGVMDLKKLSRQETLEMEPELNCVSALWSPSTGIIGSHAFMLSLLGEAEAHGATLALNSHVTKGEQVEEGILLELDGENPFQILAKNIVIAGGLKSPELARNLGLANIPKGHLCKGSYFSLTGRAPFSRLVYPIPVAGGLGVHYTLDMGGQGRFGPDVEWIEEEDYKVESGKRSDFAESIQKYWPGCRVENLEPAYAGIRPKICAAGEPDQDFRILSEAEHGVKGVVALLGIESPGLTSSLALSRRVQHIIDRESNI